MQRTHQTLYPCLRGNRLSYLHVLAHHGNHEVEQTDSLDESEAQNGVGEELTTHAGVAGNGHQEGCKDHADTDTSTTKTDSSRTHTNVLGDLHHGRGDLRGVGAAAHDVTSGGLEDGGSLLALHGLEGGIAADADAREGTLGSLSLDVASESRTSSLDGRLAHERGHLWGNDACGSHCDVRECDVWGRRGRETRLGWRTA